MLIILLTKYQHRQNEVYIFKLTNEEHFESDQLLIKAKFTPVCKVDAIELRC